MWSLLEKIEKNIVEQEVNVVVDEISILFFFFLILETNKGQTDASFILKLKLKFLNLKGRLWN